MSELEDAAVAWFHSCIAGNAALDTPEHDRLWTAIEHLVDAQEKNEPTGPVERRPWRQIPALWFVQAPGGAWYEVLSTVRDDPMQTVTIGLPNGTDMITRRSPEVEVPCRAGTLSVPWETLRDGLGAEILEDGS